MRLVDTLSRLRRLRIQFALILAAAMAPAGVLAAIQALANVEDAIDRRLELLAADVRQAAEEEQAAFVSIRETMRIVAREVGPSATAPAPCADALRRLVEGDARLARAAVLDHDGTPVCGAGPGAVAVADSTWRDFVERPRFVIGEVRDQAAPTSLITAYYPLPQPSDAAFALAVGLDLTHLRGLAATDPIQRPFVILGRGGGLLAGAGSPETDWLPTDRAVLQRSFEGTVLATSADGTERRFFVDPLIAGEVWAVSAARRLTFLELLWGAQGVLVISPILLWLIAVVVAAMAIDRLVTRHVQYLQRVTARLGRGDLETVIEPLDGAPSEIRRLGDAIRIMARNLAEREYALQDMVEAQKSLLLEVHHRVKNNLQMISSMMNMQLRRSASEAEKRSLKLVQDRIHGLAMVHQSLYATERLDSVPLAHLLRDLCEHLRVSLKPARASVAFDMELDPITVDTDVATPIALFLTEAISNVFKHAVGPDGPSTIRVELSRSETEFELRIANTLADRAVPAQPDSALPLDRASGLGSRLMSGFAKQIGGRSSRDIVDGVYRVTLTAPIRAEQTRFALRKAKAGLPG